jgi:hypothetical protein
MSTVQKARAKADIARFYAETRELYTAIESFRLKNGYYPQGNVNCTGVNSTIMGGANSEQSFYSVVQNPANQPPCTSVATSTETGINESHFMAQLKSEGLYNKVIKVPANMSLTYVIYKTPTDVLNDGPVVCGGAGIKVGTAMLVVFINEDLENIKQDLPANRKRYGFVGDGWAFDVDESFCFYVD